jgi:two-component SAPR family response regulator
MKDKFTYTCGIIEDEELAFTLLEKYINRIGIIDIKWSLPSTKHLLTVTHQKVDIVFLDLIDSPVANNTVLDNYINTYGNIIITTANTESYIKLLGLEYITILNKPFSFEIFENAIMESFSCLKPISDL